MPKKTKHPRLVSQTRKNKDGRVRTYYFYDMRHAGQKRIPLGTDYDEAIAKWHELHHDKPRTIGRVQQAINDWREHVLPTYTNEDTKDDYGRQLKRIEEVFGNALWEEVDLPALVQYLKLRKAKTQGNREMSVFSIVWNHARLHGMTTMPWPATGVKDWKNAEKAREFEVTDALFDAVYREADQMLRDCMDLSTATGMRLTDCRTVLLPQGDKLRLKASKTGKRADFDITLSEVLPKLIERRRAIPASHMMLLSTPDGFPVSAGMLRRAYDRARELATNRPENRLIRSALLKMYLRDMRKRAADLTETDDAASELLQHSSKAVTRKHYISRATNLKPVR